MDTFYPVHRVTGVVKKSAEFYDVPASNFATSATEAATEGHRSAKGISQFYRNGKTSGKFILTHSTFEK